MRGRKPKPERLRLLQEETVRVVGGTEAPTRPAWLDGDAAVEWDRLVAELSKSYTITPLDTISLATYCELFAQWRSAMREWKVAGHTTPTANGEKTNPTARLAMSLATELRRIAAEFGLTPAARSRIDVPRVGSEEEDEFEVWSNPG